MRIVPIEINVGSYEFSRRNLKELGYEGIVVVLDGSEGYAPNATYDKSASRQAILGYQNL